MNDKEAMMATGSFTVKTIQKVTHDLRAPAVNIRGFVGEVGKAVKELATLVEEHRSALPEEFLFGVSDIIEDDLQPCLHFLEKASLQFDTRINDVAEIMSGDVPEESEVPGER